MLYIGIAEEGGTTLELRSPPTGASRLAADVVQTGEAFAEAHTRAILGGLSWLGLDWDEGPVF